MGAGGDGANATQTLARKSDNVEVYAWLPLLHRDVRVLPAGSRQPKCKGWAEHAIPREDTDLPQRPNAKTPYTITAERR